MTKKKTLVNAQTDKDVDAFIDNVSHRVRQRDSRTMLEILKKMTGEEPKIWGVSIIGFGKYSYQRKNGEEYEWFNVGFSPAKAHLSIYLMFDVNEEAALLEQLGPYKAGKGCLYIKDLEQVDMKVLKKLLKKSKSWQR